MNIFAFVVRPHNVFIMRAYHKEKELYNNIVLEHHVTQQHNTYEGVLSTSDMCLVTTCIPVQNKRDEVPFGSHLVHKRHSPQSYASQLAGVFDHA